MWQGHEEESDEEIEALQHGEDEHDEEREGEDGPAADADDDDDDEEEGEGGGEAAGAHEGAGALAAAPREPERQLSKKELKKKEMEDLEKVLAELGIQAQANGEGPPPRSSARQRTHQYTVPEVRRGPVQL